MPRSSPGLQKHPLGVKKYAESDFDTPRPSNAPKWTKNTNPPTLSERSGVLESSCPLFPGVNLLAQKGVVLRFVLKIRQNQLINHLKFTQHEKIFIYIYIYIINTYNIYIIKPVSVFTFLTYGWWGGVGTQWVPTPSPPPPPTHKWTKWILRSVL